MSDISHTPAPEAAMNTAARENLFPSDRGCIGSTTASVAPARLQAIHELIRSGDYHIPASAIADRMIERMIADRRRRRN